MLTRGQLDDLLVDYLYDELSADDRRAFESAVAEHPEVAEEIEAHRHTRRVMSGRPLADPPQHALDAVARAARQAAAPAARPESLWSKLLAMFAQPAFATMAVVAGVAVTAVVTLDGPTLDGGQGPATSSAPVVAQADSPRAPPEAVADEPSSELASKDRAVAAVDGVKASSPSRSASPEPAAEAGAGAVAKAEQVAPAGDEDAQVQVASAPKAKRSKRKASGRRTTKRLEKTNPPVVASAKSAPDALGNTVGAHSAGRVAASEADDSADTGLKVAGAMPAKAATVARTPSIPPSATTHPGMDGDAVRTPANTKPRMTRKFAELIAGGKLDAAAKVLAELEKLPTMRKSEAKRLRKQLASARASAGEKKARVAGKKAKAAGKKRSSSRKASQPAPVAPPKK